MIESDRCNEITIEESRHDVEWSYLSIIVGILVICAGIIFLVKGIEIGIPVLSVLTISIILLFFGILLLFIAMFMLRRMKFFLTPQSFTIVEKSRKVKFYNWVDINEILIYNQPTVLNELAKLNWGVRYNSSMMFFNGKNGKTLYLLIVNLDIDCDTFDKLLISLQNYSEITSVPVVCQPQTSLLSFKEAIIQSKK